MTAALEVFVSAGYHAAAMDDIADRAGVSKPVLYQHFPGKLELYLAILEDAADHVIGLATQALESTTENRHRVAATVAAFYDYVDSEQGAFRLVFESDLTNEPAVRYQVERVVNESAALIADVISDDTGLDPESATLIAVSLVGMAQVSARYWLHGVNDRGSSMGKDQAARLVSALAWRGISGNARTDETK